jgi:hypothetical protein
MLHTKSHSLIPSHAPHRLLSDISNHTSPVIMWIQLDQRVFLYDIYAK